jgi:hypothetical protein
MIRYQTELCITCGYGPCNIYSGHVTKGDVHVIAGFCDELIGQDGFVDVEIRNRMGRWDFSEKKMTWWSGSRRFFHAFAWNKHLQNYTIHVGSSYYPDRLFEDVIQWLQDNKDIRRE